MNLTAWSARAGLAHLPEIIFLAKAQNTLARRSNLLPKLLGVLVRANLVIAFEHGEPHARGIELEFIHEQVPRELDRIFFEVITEGKISEHLEKSLVPRGLADFIEIVMFAAGAQTFLRRAGAHVVALLVP